MPYAGNNILMVLHNIEQAQKNLLDVLTRYPADADAKAALTKLEETAVIVRRHHDVLDRASVMLDEILKESPRSLA